MKFVIPIKSTNTNEARLTARFFMDVLKECHFELQCSAKFFNDKLSLYEDNVVRGAPFDGFVAKTGYVPFFERNNATQKQKIKTRAGKKQTVIINPAPLLEIMGDKKNQSVTIEYHGKRAKRFRRHLLRNAFKAYLFDDASDALKSQFLQVLAQEAVQTFGINQLEKFFRNEIIEHLDKYKGFIERYNKDNQPVKSTLIPLCDAERLFLKFLKNGRLSHGNLNSLLAVFKDFRESIESKFAYSIITHWKNYEEFLANYRNTLNFNNLLSTSLVEKKMLLDCFNSYTEQNQDIEQYAKAWFACQELDFNLLTLEASAIDKKNKLSAPINEAELLEKLLTKYASKHDAEAVLNNDLLYKIISKLYKKNHSKLAVIDSELAVILNRNITVETYTIQQVFKTKNKVYKVKDHKGDNFIVKEYDFVNSLDVDALHKEIATELAGTNYHFETWGLPTGRKIEQENGKVYLIFPFIPHQSHRNIDNLNKFLLTSSSACRKLGELHAKNLFPRDVKPDNILLLEDFSVAFIDFGEMVNAEKTARSQGVAGSEPFFAPQEFGDVTIELSEKTAIIDYDRQYKGSKYIDNRLADTYKLGLSLLSILLGGTQQILTKAEELNDFDKAVYKDFLLRLANDKIESISSPIEQDILRSIINQIEKMLNCDKSVGLYEMAELFDTLRTVLPQSPSTWINPVIEKEPELIPEIVQAKADEKPYRHRKVGENLSIIMPDKPPLTKPEELQKYITDMYAVHENFEAAVKEKRQAVAFNVINELNEKLGYYRSEFIKLQKERSSIKQFFYSGLTMFTKLVPFGNHIEDKLTPRYVKKLRVLKSFFIADILNVLPALTKENIDENKLINKILNHPVVSAKGFNTCEYLRKVLKSHLSQVRNEDFIVKLTDDSLVPRSKQQQQPNNKVPNSSYAYNVNPKR